MFIYNADGTIVRPQQGEQIRQRIQKPTLVKTEKKDDSKDRGNKSCCWLSCLFWIFLILLVIAVFLCFNNNKKEEVKPSFGYYF